MGKWGRGREAYLQGKVRGAEQGGWTRKRHAEKETIHKVRWQVDMNM